MKAYKFAVSLCGGWCDGTIEINAKDDDEAYEKAQDYVVERLVQVFPELSIDYDIECENPDYEDCDDDEVEEDMETCPVCGAEIEVCDGEDNGYGELHMYWTCDVCGSSGKAIIDQHHDNAFIGHEID